MDITTIFVTQFLMSVFVFAVIGRWYLTPWLGQKSHRAALMILVLPHAFRHIGLLFVVPDFVTSELDASFANVAAYGDLASAILAIAALFLLKSNSRIAIPAVWVFNTVGSVDLINALRQTDTVPDLGIVWVIPTFIVPALLVTHALIFVRLLKRRYSNVESWTHRPSQSTPRRRIQRKSRGSTS